MKRGPQPPKTYETFVRRYPKLSEAWEKISEAGREGPIDSKNSRLIKLAIAIGAMRERGAFQRKESPGRRHSG